MDNCSLDEDFEKKINRETGLKEFERKKQRQLELLEYQKTHKCNFGDIEQTHPKECCKECFNRNPGAFLCDECKRYFLFEQCYSGTNKFGKTLTTCHLCAKYGEYFNSRKLN